MSIKNFPEKKNKEKDYQGEGTDFSPGTCTQLLQSYISAT